jgi:hypothetical protein
MASRKNAGSRWQSGSVVNRGKDRERELSPLADRQSLEVSSGHILGQLLRP